MLELCCLSGVRCLRPGDRRVLSECVRDGPVDRRQVSLTLWWFEMVSFIPLRDTSEAGFLARAMNVFAATVLERHCVQIFGCLGSMLMYKYMLEQSISKIRVRRMRWRLT